MKKIKQLYGSMIPALMICMVMTACNDDVENVYNYLRVSDKTVFIDALGEQNATITIFSNMRDPQAVVSSTGDWLVMIASTTNLVMVGANSQNLTGEPREGTITVTVGDMTETVTVIQYAVSDYNLVNIESTQIMQVIMSADGKYLAGLKLRSAGTIFEELYYYTPVLIDVETGSMTALPEKQIQSVVLKAVSNDGVLLVLDDVEAKSYVINETGAWEEITMPGYYNIEIQSLNGDGTVMVGAAKAQGELYYIPFKWVNGIPTELPMIDETFLGDSMTQNGCIARGLSEDGSVIYGQEMSTDAAIYWDASGQFRYAAEDIIETHHFIVGEGEEWEFEQIVFNCMFITAETNSKITPDGRYIVSVYNYASEPEQYNFVRYPVLFDTETRESTVFWQHADMSAQCMSSEGIISFSSPALQFTTGGIYDFNNSTFIGSTEWIKQRYGLSRLQNPVIMEFATDSNTILGTYRDMDSFSPSDRFFYIHYTGR